MGGERPSVRLNVWSFRVCPIKTAAWFISRAYYFVCSEKFDDPNRAPSFSRVGEGWCERVIGVGSSLLISRRARCAACDNQTNPFVCRWLFSRRRESAFNNAFTAGQRVDCPPCLYQCRLHLAQRAPRSSILLVRTEQRHCPRLTTLISRENITWPPVAARNYKWHGEIVSGARTDIENYRTIRPRARRKPLATGFFMVVSLIDELYWRKWKGDPGQWENVIHNLDAQFLRCPPLNSCSVAIASLMTTASISWPYQ